MCLSDTNCVYYFININRKVYWYYGIKNYRPKRKTWISSGSSPAMTSITVLTDRRICRRSDSVSVVLTNPPSLLAGTSTMIIMKDNTEKDNETVIVILDQMNQKSDIEKALLLDKTDGFNVFLNRRKIIDTWDTSLKSHFAL